MCAKPADDFQDQDDQATDVATEGEAGNSDAPSRLDLIVDITSPSACERHVTITVSRADIDRYFDDAYSNMLPKASVPGFRIGRAPRKIVEARFRDEVTEQVKGSLLMDCLEQLGEDKHFAAISEPEFDLEAIEVPDSGPMTFEFDIEVRPEFEMPKWKGLKIRRPVREFTDADIDQQLQQRLTRYAQLAPSKNPATVGDYLTVDITSKLDGQTVESDEERVIRIQPNLSFSDCTIEGFDKLMEGVKAGDVKSTDVTLSDDAPNQELAGSTLTVEFKVLDVKSLKLPEMDEDFLKEIGGFNSEEELREAIRKNLERQLEYHQQQKAREQITSLLVESADWDLPPGLLKRQSAREHERAVMELRRSGFSEVEIRARENVIRQNSKANTATALKEHFILERIAEEENIDAAEGDYEAEIFLIAAQSGESPRRVRAQLEKRGLMDVLRNQIVERKVLQLVQSEAQFQDEEYSPTSTDTEAINLALGGEGADAIPQATEEKASSEKSASSESDDAS